MYNLRITHKRKISAIHVETVKRRMAQALESFNFLAYLLHSNYKDDELTSTQTELARVWTKEKFHKIVLS